MKKLIIIGLGNPGEEYKNTPHNIGFETLDKIVETLQDNGNPTKERHAREGATYEFNINEKRIVLLKPLLYMNLSGSAVKKVLKENNADPKKKLWVIHDDVDIEAGTIKVKKGGGSAGHKGIENIAKSVGTNDFWRFRVGIRPKNAPVKRSPEFMSEFVTKKNGIKTIAVPLYAHGVSRLFIESVKDMLQVVIVAAPESERMQLPWNVQFIYPHALEDRYVARAMAESPEGIREDYLRNRFRNYMHRFRLYTAQKKKLSLQIELQANTISVNSQ